METGQGVVRLVSPDSGQEYARLEDPNQERACPDLLQSRRRPTGRPDAETASRSTSGTCVPSGSSWSRWGWTGPCRRTHRRRRSTKRSRSGSRSSSAIRLELPRDREEITRQAIEQKRRALEANPNDAAACNDLAWTYLTAPESLRDWKAALPLAQKAVQLDPGPMNRNTLGLAYYRAGRYREAVETLQPNLKDQVDWALAFDLYFLAMSHHQLGEIARARQFYDLAVRWSGTHSEALKPYARGNGCHPGRSGGIVGGERQESHNRADGTEAESKIPSKRPSSPVCRMPPDFPEPETSGR